MTANAKVNSLLARSHKIRQAAALFQDWSNAKDIAEVLGHNQLRDSLIDSTYRAYRDFLYKNDLTRSQAAIQDMAASVQ